MTSCKTGGDPTNSSKTVDRLHRWQAGQKRMRARQRACLRGLSAHVPTVWVRLDCTADAAHDFANPQLAKIIWMRQPSANRMPQQR
jgi:hypothetical protein